MTVKVSMDDERIMVFAQRFPETTAAAAYWLAELLAAAEQKGRDASATTHPHPLAKQELTNLGHAVKWDCKGCGATVTGPTGQFHFSECPGRRLP